MISRCLIIFSAFFSLHAGAQFYYGSHQDFGKSRVQHNLPHNWTYYKFDKYEVYFYQGGKELGEYVSMVAKDHLAQIEKLFDFPLDTKIEFLIYNKQSDFKASNLGLIAEEMFNVGGVTRIVGTKVSLFFDGDHKKLEQQVRSGIAEVIINQMMYGGNVKEMVKNSTFLVLPDWYTQGLVSYVSGKHDIEVDNRVKDGILNGKYNKFNHLSGNDATAAGHSLWAYVAETYGESVISNILYMTKLSRNVENAFLFVLGVSVKNVTNEWIEFYMTRYADADAKNNLPALSSSIVPKPKASRVYNQAKLSPDGKWIAYVSNEMGQYKVWLYNTETKKHKRIIKREQKLDRINDYSFPLLTWHPTSEILAVITEQKGELLMTYHTIENGRKDVIKMVNFEKILDLGYSPDGKKIAISGVNKGQSDIYVYSVAGGNIDQITNDVFDDLNPRFLQNGKKIIFSSNRTNDTLRPQEKVKGPLRFYKDLFIYNYAARGLVLKRVTSTPFANEIQPFPFDTASIAYLSDENGVRNRYIAMFDSVLAYVDTTEHYRYITRTMSVTNFTRNVMEHAFNPGSNKFTQVIFHNGQYRIYVEDMSSLTSLVPVDLKNTWFADHQMKLELTGSGVTNPVNSVNIKVKSNPNKSNEKRDSTLIDIDNYVFDKEKQQVKKEEPKKIDPEKTDVKKTVKDTSSTGTNPFVLGRMWNYNVYFTTNHVITQFDNTFLNPTYQRFTGGTSPIYINPGFSAIFRIEMSDLFEDHKITGGARLPWDLSSNEFFLSYANRLKRWDREVILHRQSLLDVEQGAYLVKVHTHQVKYVVKYPFNEVSCLRATASIRYDRTTYLALEQVSLDKLNKYEYWGGMKLEYIYDNTIKRGLNLYRGWRLKVFAEIFSQTKAETDLGVVGFDVRHYKKIHRDFIWANRLSGSSSFGHQKLVYYMGGVDAWVNTPKFNRAIPVALTEPYAYQTLATPMRGFWQNIRNGNNFVLLNSELRMPLFKYLLNKPIKSDFLQNFQVVAFGDVGTAWNGPDPFSDKNALNTVYIGSPGHPITVILKNQREPIVGGYGFGMRSRILGYFVRADWSWGIDDGQVLDRLFYLSFSLDF